jgi:RHS repeat-associated protein
MHHLVAIDYPGTADDVSYVYGGQDAAENGAGVVVREEDGSRITTNGYDVAGDTVRQTATIKLHNWTPTADQSKFTWTTKWNYDGLGRMKSMVYPDATQLAFTAQYNNGIATGTDPGEQLSYDYDAGGQLKSVLGSEPGVITQQVGTNLDGTPILAQLPHTWNYSYLQDRQYDVFLHRRSDTLGNGDNTVFSYDENTQWLTHQRTVSPHRNLQGQSTAYQEIQDLGYVYDSVGNPTSYTNDLPAATPSLFGGPSSQSYQYDPYGRLVGASGQWQQATDKTRKYTLSLAYDNAGNLTSKNQSDVVVNGKKSLVQTATTYSFGSTFTNAAPHQATKTGVNSMKYDADGNLTRIVDPKNKDVRAVSYDSADRMRVITDGPQTTTYNYDDQGNRTIEGGPGGETATLNQWVTIVDGAPLWKHIWAGDDRISTQRDDGGNNEINKQYFMHKDLQGSANVVTDANGDTFQHHEYFAGGEQWVTEDSTVFRTPYQYAGGYLDEQRSVIDLGARWYDQIRNTFYSPDPLLTDDPTAVQDEPGLSNAYSYALSNPVGYVDPTGYRPLRPGHSRADDLAMEKTRKDYAAGKGPDKKLNAKIAKQAKHQKRFEMLDDLAQPFVEINVTTGEIRIGPGLVKTWAVRKAKKAPAAAAAGAAGAASGSAALAGNATNGAGGRRHIRLLQPLRPHRLLDPVGWLRRPMRAREQRLPNARHRNRSRRYRRGAPEQAWAANRRAAGVAGRTREQPPSEGGARRDIQRRHHRIDPCSAGRPEPRSQARSDAGRQRKIGKNFGSSGTHYFAA